MWGGCILETSLEELGVIGEATHDHAPVNVLELAAESPLFLCIINLELQIGRYTW
jgi:hypothetical protein